MSVKSIRIFLYNYLVPIAILVSLLFLWQIICVTFKVPVWLLPSPTRIYFQTAKWAHFLPLHLGVTLYETIAGFVLALVIGLPLAIMVVYTSASVIDSRMSQ